MNDRPSRHERRRPAGSADHQWSSRPARDLLASPSQGAPLAATTERHISAALGHDFSTIRVHDDAESDALTRELDARALASGSHVYFRAGAFAPETTDGLRVIAHEAAHVAQQANGEVDAVVDDRGIAESRDDRHELSADAAASRVVRNAEARTIGAAQQSPLQPAQSSHTSITPSANGAIQRWPWDDDDKKDGGSPGVLDSLGGMASSVGGAVSSGASTALDWGNTAGNAISSAESSAWSGTKSAYGAVTGAYDSVAPNFTKSNQDLGSLVDMGEAAAKKGNAQMVAQYGDTPVLGSLAKASAWLSDTTIDATGGVVKGVGDIATAAGNAFVHPIDSAMALGEGALGIAEHVPLIPGLNTTVKGIHGLVDLARGKTDGEYGSTLGDLGENLLLGTRQDPDDPSKRTSADLDFFAGMGGGTKAWADKPGEAATRTITNLLPMLLGDEGAAGSKPVVEPPIVGEPPTLRSPINPDLPPPKPAPQVPIVDPAVPGTPVFDPDPIPAGPKTLRSPGVDAPVSAAPSAPETVREPAVGPKPARLPGEPFSEVPDNPPPAQKPSAPIPREDPLSGPIDTVREIPPDFFQPLPSDPLPSTLPRPSIEPLPPTLDAPASQGSAVPTERGLGSGLPAIPRGTDPGLWIDLLLGRSGGGSVVELLREYGEPLSHRRP